MISSDINYNNIEARQSRRRRSISSRRFGFVLIVSLLLTKRLVYSLIYKFPLLLISTPLAVEALLLLSRAQK